jgi:predicted ATPase
LRKAAETGPENHFTGYKLHNNIMKYAGDAGIGYIAVVSCICDDIGVRCNKKSIDHITLSYIEHTTR